MLFNTHSLLRKPQHLAMRFPHLKQWSRSEPTRKLMIPRLLDWSSQVSTSFPCILSVQMSFWHILLQWVRFRIFWLLNMLTHSLQLLISSQSCNETSILYRASPWKSRMGKEYISSWSKFGWSDQPRFPYVIAPHRWGSTMHRLHKSHLLQLPLNFRLHPLDDKCAHVWLSTHLLSIFFNS